MLISPAAFIAAVLSALALYAGSVHCRWHWLRGLRASGSWVGLALSGLSLWWWVLALGGGAGLCVMLGTWMLAMMVIPYLGALTSPAPDHPRESA